MNIDAILAQLKIDEGFKDKVYTDTNGNKTIGYGHRVVQGEAWDDGITKDEAHDLLVHDVHRTIKQMNILYPWWGNLPNFLQDAFLNMCFNMGTSKMLTFHTFLDMLKTGRYNEAGDDLIHTLWHHQVGDRAKRIEAVFKRGTNEHQQTS